MGVRGRHRTPTAYRPDHTYRHAAILLACCAGIIVAAMQEAAEAHDTAWAWTFAVLLVVDIWLYFSTCWAWLDASE